jgi:hypothetical protein
MSLNQVILKGEDAYKTMSPPEKNYFELEQSNLNDMKHILEMNAAIEFSEKTYNNYHDCMISDSVEEFEYAFRDFVNDLTSEEYHALQILSVEYSIAALEDREDTIRQLLCKESRTFMSKIISIKMED